MINRVAVPLRPENQCSGVDLRTFLELGFQPRARSDASLRISEECVIQCDSHANVSRDGSQSRSFDVDLHDIGRATRDLELRVDGGCATPSRDLC